MPPERNSIDVIQQRLDCDLDHDAVTYSYVVVAIP